MLHPGERRDNARLTLCLTPLLRVAAAAGTIAFMQVPAQFEYERASSVEHALALLAKYGPESRVIAGGHSLIPMMKLRLARPEALIDVNELAELATIEVTGDELRIGALVRHAELLASEVAGGLFPILHDAERVIADPIVRNRGTIGGSLCQADPSEDLSAAFTAVRAIAVIRGEEGERTVPVRDFFAGPYDTVVGPAELLVELRLPIRDGLGSAYTKVGRRAGDWAVAAAGAALALDGPDVTEAGIGLTAVGAPRFVAAEAEDFLRGGAATPDRFEKAGTIAAGHCSPAADQRGPADYKRHLVATLTTRALHLAQARAEG
ncbi:carbon-monoxide dehydrogenase medium subunit [Amycolatopsis saalfeldensis]|uniref:Carbon-monoxide dehydrogenase medium subunit n=2 Tax=Amycolatopsis saalfeldensis TaxID=394193 RepID=A0A1H8YEX7_9PSEU|nr:carbon-monoxide dehydrogenase medium subunit [Amycolatopsis saalfeldensis]